MREPLTPTESRIVAMLSDGQAHSREELCSCLYDELSVSSLRVHILNIRRKLPPSEFIDCVVRGYVYYYRHGRYLCSANRD